MTNVNVTAVGLLETSRKIHWIGSSWTLLHTWQSILPLITQ